MFASDGGGVFFWGFSVSLSDDDLRKRIDAELEGFVDNETIRLVIATALKAKKQARGWCPNCKKAVQVEIDDSMTSIKALETLANQAKGRPDVAGGVDEEKIVFDHVVEWGCENCSCESCLKDRGEPPAA